MATSSRETARVALPGRMLKKEGRWWWSVQLPGEIRCRARALRGPEERIATSDRRVAEAVALNLWQEAVKREARAEIQVEVKNQSLEKSRAYAFLIDHMTEQPRCSYRQAPWTAPSTFQLSTELDIELPSYDPIEKMSFRAVSVPQNKAPLPETDTLAGSTLDLMGILSGKPEMQDRQGCECCGSKDFFDEYLQTVENGQKLCPRCVQAMREDTLVAESCDRVMV